MRRINCPKEFLKWMTVKKLLIIVKTAWTRWQIIAMPLCAEMSKKAPPTIGLRRWTHIIWINYHVHEYWPRCCATEKESFAKWSPEGKGEKPTDPSLRNHSVLARHVKEGEKGTITHSKGEQGSGNFISKGSMGKTAEARIKKRCTLSYQSGGRGIKSWTKFQDKEWKTRWSR